MTLLAIGPPGRKPHLLLLLHLSVRREAAAEPAGMCGSRSAEATRLRTWKRGNEGMAVLEPRSLSSLTPKTNIYEYRLASGTIRCWRYNGEP
jgi:hypothetical protein